MCALDRGLNQLQVLGASSHRCCICWRCSDFPDLATCTPGPHQWHVLPSQPPLQLLVRVMLYAALLMPAALLAAAVAAGLGALVVRRRLLPVLQQGKAYFGGGTVEVVLPDSPYVVR